MESKFKVGDRVLSMVYGAGTVIQDKSSDSWPIHVDFQYSKNEDYTSDGKLLDTNIYPDIYKDGDIHPLLNVPIRIPKQKVKKQFELFLHKERVQNSFVLEWDNGRFWVSDLMYDKPCISAKIIFEVEE